MNSISKEDLLKHRETVANQITAYTGALQLLDHLLQSLSKTEMTPNELAEVVAGKGATAEIIPLTKE